MDAYNFVRVVDETAPCATKALSLVADALLHTMHILNSQMRVATGGNMREALSAMVDATVLLRGVGWNPDSAWSHGAHG